MKYIKNPVFNYTSKCCGAPGRKPPCERSADDRKEGKFSQSSLGTWNCSQCGNVCAVTRARRKENHELLKNGTGTN